jgi:ADP-L-glycero-D-manno-heptose 6-epimerase
MYIVTGGAGFIGSAVVWKLNRLGIEDILVVDNLGTSEKWKNLVNLRYADYIHKHQFLKLVLEGEDPFGTEAIVHLGACSSTTEQDADYLMDNNYRYSQILARFATAHGIRLINASSAATYGDGSQGFSDAGEGFLGLTPLNMYGYSKQLFDCWAHRQGLLPKLASLKFFNVYGPNEQHKDDMKSVICKAYSQVLETGVIRLFKSYDGRYADGGQMRDFLYVKDAVEVIWWLIEHPEASGIFNVGCGTARTWNDLANAVFAAMGREPKIEYIDMPEGLRGKYQYFTEAEMGKIRAAGCDVAFASLEEGVRDYVTGYLAGADPHLHPDRA